jgi:hypothetical protein
VPSTPADLVAVVAVVGAPEDAGEAVRAALGGGRRTVAALEWMADKRVWRAELGSEAEAVAAVEAVAASPPAALGKNARASRWYNDRPYAGRGWCTLEWGASSEIVARVAYFPEVEAELAGRPEKLVDIGGDAPGAMKVEADEEGAGERIKRICHELDDEARTQFTGRGDRKMVLEMFLGFEVHVANTVIAVNNALGGVKVDYTGELNAEKQREGSGTVTFPDGSVYEGEFKADKKHGNGKCTYVNGATFEGTYKANERDGEGTYTFPRREPIDVRYENGVMVKGEALGIVGQEIKPQQSFGS